MLAILAFVASVDARTERISASVAASSALLAARWAAVFALVLWRAASGTWLGQGEKC